MKDTNKSSGIGIMGVIQIVFLILKLTNLVTWPWHVVLAPMIIDVLLFLLALVIIKLAE